jgi:hypothetical protein
MGAGSTSEKWDLGLIAGWRAIAATAKALLGAPDQISTESKGRDTVYVYCRENGNIELVMQRLDSEEFKGAKWLLRWRPGNTRPESHLPREVLENLPEVVGAKAVYLLCEDGMVGIALDESRVDAVLWLRRGPEALPHFAARGSGDDQPRRPRVFSAGRSLVAPECTT